MKRLIIAAVIILGAGAAEAGKVKLNWLEKQTDNLGNPVTITEFTVYWGHTSDQMTTQIPIFGSKPWKMEPGQMGRYSKTLENDIWDMGVNVCFSMTAHSGDLVSPMSNTICKTLTGTPDAPDIINLDELP